MAPYHPQAEEGEDKHEYNFMDSRVAYDPCLKSSWLWLSIIFISYSLVLKVSSAAFIKKKQTTYALQVEEAMSQTITATAINLHGNLFV